MTGTSETTPYTYPLRVADLAARKATRFDLLPETAALGRIAQALGISEVRKLRMTGTLTPKGSADWLLEATLGATVVQPCVVTLAPVTTRIDEPVTRHYIEAPAEPEPESETEMSVDDSTEALGPLIDLGSVMVEALSLALPPYPRAEDAELGEAVFTEPGKSPMRDEEARPFAGLAALRDKLEKDN